MSDFTENLRHFTEVGSGYTVDGIMSAAADHIESLEAQLQESRKDAADAKRYRYLVANSFDKAGVLQFHVWEHSWQPHSQTGDPTEWKCRVRGPALDRAIDAAMSQENADHDQQ